MSLLSSVFASPISGYRMSMVSTFGVQQAASPTHRMLCDLLDLYYKNNDLYNDLSLTLAEFGNQRQPRRPLRNPAFRVVEFYAGKLWPGDLPDALPIVADNREIVEPIHRIWKWSNWTGIKQQAVRLAAIHGDLFIKVVQRQSTTTGEARVYFEVVPPRVVHDDLQTDERGYVTHIRLDIPKTRVVGDRTVPYTHTEVWDKDARSYRLWEHDRGEDAALERLGTPAQTASLAEFGIDFLPFVHAKFRDIGETRGAGSYVLQLTKVDEVNAMATRLHEIMYRYGKPVWAVLSDTLDPSGEPLPAPRIDDSEMNADPRYDPEEGGTFLGDEPVLYLPGKSKAQLLLPNIAYDSLLRGVESQMEELEYDLPELNYYRVVKDLRETSGRALAYLLSPAVDRVMEVRSNLYHALVRADQIGLSIGQAAGIFPSSLGSYDSGDFEHAFAKQDVIPLGRLDIAEAQRAEGESAERRANLGVPQRQLWRELHYSEDEIVRMEREKAAQDAEAARQFQAQAASALPGDAKGVQDRNDPNVGRRSVAGQDVTARGPKANQGGA